MDQVSRPLLIALGGVVALLAIWLVALRPKPVAIEHTPLAPTQEIAKARKAVGISDGANAKVQAATGAANAAPATPAATPANPSAAKPATSPSTAGAPKVAHAPATARSSVGARRNAAIMRLVDHGKVVVMLFWNAKSADDVATRGALRDLDLHGGKVVVRVVPIGDVAQYTSITQSVKIAQSPTTVVIGRKGATRVIAGLSEPREISQAVGDALAGR